MGTIRVVPFRPEHGRAVAQLHREALPNGFLSSLGDRFLSELYRGISGARDATVLVAEASEGQCVGFVSGSAALQATYRSVLTQHLPSLLIALLPACLTPRAWSRALQTIAYPFRRDLGSSTRRTSDGADLPSAELLSIAVSETARGRKVGKRLVEALETFFSDQHRIDRYRVVTDALDPRSNGFYQGTGFVVTCEFHHHGHPMRMYTKNIVGRADRIYTPAAPERGATAL